MGLGVSTSSYIDDMCRCHIGVLMGLGASTHGSLSHTVAAPQE